MSTMSLTLVSDVFCHKVRIGSETNILDKCMYFVMYFFVIFVLQFKIEAR